MYGRDVSRQFTLSKKVFTNNLSQRLQEDNQRETFVTLAKGAGPRTYDCHTINRKANCSSIFVIGQLVIEIWYNVIFEILYSEIHQIIHLIIMMKIHMRETLAAETTSRNRETKGFQIFLQAIADEALAGKREKC